MSGHASSPSGELGAKSGRRRAKALHSKDAHEQDAHHGPTGPEQSREEYEAQFPLEPETPRAATTFELFSEPDRISSGAVSRKTYYLTDEMVGVLWLDADADGRRGSATNSTLNAMEYDVGIGGVNVQLVKCDNDEPLFQKTSRPNAGFGEGSSVKRTDVPEAGLYNFELQGVEPGRYYVMYQAPKNYRMNGNVLPLEREMVEGGAYFTCIPKGGEGNAYLEEVMAKGDLDWGGYCARSVGCVEVDKKYNMSNKYKSLEYLNLNDGWYEGSARNMNMLALPSANVLSVGLAKEDWGLSTYQFADIKITLSFPSSVDESELGQAIPGDFDRSELKSELETTLARLYASEVSSFGIQGVEVHSGEIIVAQGDGAANEEEPTVRRGMRDLQDVTRVPPLPRDSNTANDTVGNAGNKEAGDAARGDARPTQDRYTPRVVYKLTARGRYNPPPHQQLGAILQDSVNQHPDRLVKSLKERQAGLPPVFKKLEGASARHLTIRVAEKGQGSVTERQKTLNAKADVGGMASWVRAPVDAGEIAGWARVPVILLALTISALVGVLVFRRVFINRKRKRRRYLPGIFRKRGPWTASDEEEFLNAILKELRSGAV